VGNQVIIVVSCKLKKEKQCGKNKWRCTVRGEECLVSSKYGRLCTQNMDEATGVFDISEMEWIDIRIYNVQKNNMVGIQGDSAEYEYLTEAVRLSKDVKGLCIELGVRRGMGCKTLMDAVKEYCPDKSVIGVDPYGNIEYFHKENEKVRLDYTNTMKNEAMQALYAYSESIGVYFNHYTLEDTEFFNSFKNGVPIYKDFKEVINQYSVVHFDAPHAVKEILAEINFFKQRTPKGGCWIFDDILDFYPHDEEVEPFIIGLGFELIKKGNKKALYQRI